MSFQGTELASEETPNILSCEQPQDFWLSWKDNKFKFGLNSYIDELVLLEYEEEISDVQGIQVSSGHDSSVTWRWQVEERKQLPYHLYSQTDIIFLMSLLEFVDGLQDHVLRPKQGQNYHVGTRDACTGV